MSAEIKHAEFCVLGCFFPGNPKMNPNPHMQGSTRGETFKGFKVTAGALNQNSKDERLLKHYTFQ